MGDRCDSHVTCLPKDVKFFKETFGYEVEEEFAGRVLLYDEQANYGHHSGLLEVKRRPFIAHNGAGSDYGCSSYVSSGGPVLYTDDLQDEGSDSLLTVGIMPLTGPFIAGAGHAIAFMQTLFKAKLKLGMVEDAAREKQMLKDLVSALRKVKRVGDKLHEKWAVPLEAAPAAKP